MIALFLPATLIAADQERPLIQLEFDTLDYEAVHISKAHVELDPLDRQTYKLEFRADSLHLAADQPLSNIDILCEVTQIERVLECQEGVLSLEHPQFGGLRGRLTFSYHLDDGLQQVQLQAVPLAGGQLALDLDGPAPDWRLNAQLQGMDLESAQPLLNGTGMGNATQGLQGSITGTMTASGWPLTSIRADLTLANVNYEGTSVAQAVSGKASLRAEHSDGKWQGDTALTIDAGELYLVAPLHDTESAPGFYIAIKEQPLTADSAFRYQPDSDRLTFTNFVYDHPGILSLSADGQLRLTDEISIEQLVLDLPATDLTEAFPVYGQPWLIDTPYNDIRVTGALAVELAMSDGKTTALEVMLDNVDLTDSSGRFNVIGLETDLQLDAGQDHESYISWAGIDLYRIALASGAIRLASRGFDVEVTDWQDVTVLDGILRINQFGLQDPGTDDFALRMAGALQDVSLPTLTRALEWPEFSGSLSGEFSGLSYEDGDLRMEGELLMRMFNGRVRLRNLQVRDLFGSLPVLTADVDVAQIDLLQLTDTFAFGKITGKLSGHVHGLRLENWQPVAFDAELSTRDDGDVRHRISQQALNNLSQIGGGLSGALSRGFLRYFDEYSYGELGVSCRLERGFCHLGGVEQYDEGHYLLTRGGLLPPWVEVRLAGTVVAWDVLIEGFEQIAEGEVKIE